MGSSLFAGAAAYKAARASLSQSTPCLFALTVAPPPSWPTAVASALAQSRTRTPLISRTRAPVLPPRTRARSLGGKEPPVYLSFPSTELSSSAFRCGEPRHHPLWCLFARWCERRGVLEPACSFSSARTRSLAGPATPATPLRARFATRGRAPSPPRVCFPSPGAPTLHAYQGSFLSTCSPLCWRTHLDAVGHPNLTVVGYRPAVVLAMVSTHRASFSSSGMLLSFPSEPNGSHESCCGTCCLAAASPRRRRALPGAAPLEHYTEHLVTEPKKLAGVFSPGPQPISCDLMRLATPGL
jgi:hypothetical protein